MIVYNTSFSRWVCIFIQEIKPVCLYKVRCWSPATQEKQLKEVERLQVFRAGPEAQPEGGQRRLRCQCHCRERGRRRVHGRAIAGGEEEDCFRGGWGPE